MGFYWGGIGGVALAVTNSYTIPVVSNMPWDLWWEGQVRVLSTVAGGSTGQVQGQGTVHFGATLTTYATPQPFPATLALRTVSIDTSLDKVLTAGCTLSTTTGTPTVTCNGLDVEVLG